MTSRLSRRQFVVGAGVASLGLLTGCGRLPWQAQPAKVSRVGYLVVGAPVDLDPFFARLSEHGYTEGQNLTFEVRSGEYDNDRLADLATELVHLPVDVLLVASTPAHLAAARATNSIPIVTVGGDPVRDGLAASYARPGGNVTGFTTLNITLSAKRLELLKQTVPTASRIGVLWNAGNSAKAADFRETQSAAHLLGLELISLEVRRPEEMTAAFELASRGGADALVVLGDNLTINSAIPIAALAARHGLPTQSEGRPWVVAGGLMGYGPSLADNYRRAGDYVGRILKGTKPADLPVEQPMRFEFVVNMKTARALGIVFPHEVALQITEVIDG